MNLALKSIGRISELLGVSPLSQSPLWNKTVDKITPNQVTVFLSQCHIYGRRDEGETAIDIAQREVAAYIDKNQLERPAFLNYRTHYKLSLTLDELKKGLQYLPNERAHAVLFALETNLDATGVAMLTHSSLRKMKLTDLATLCAQCCPRQISMQYVFWQHDDSFNLPLPLFGLDADVFDAFGLVWGELALGYQNIMKGQGFSASSEVLKLSE